MERTIRAHARYAAYAVLMALTTALTGCLERELKPLNPCLVSGVVASVEVRNVDKIDLLFMVDNSHSMLEEQASLAREIPDLIRILTSGDRDLDGVQDFPPAKNLHIGVVSSDLGLPGIPHYQNSNCIGLGDNGVLRATPTTTEASCSGTRLSPPFLTYDKAAGDDADKLVQDFACIAKLGTTGCGFEQQLESALKAVWPGNDTAVRFVADSASGMGMTGNGGPGFANGDFIRNDPNEGPSLVAIVLVTDEEDCSSNRLDHFLPSASNTGVNTRCFHEGQRPEPNNLFDVERYIETFKALRPHQENLVIFAGIVGVPPELVTREQLELQDFEDPAGADAFFDGLLAAPAMQEQLDDQGTADPSDDNLVPSCDRGPNARAFPPRRIVQVAKGFGKNGIIQSICQESFKPAMDAIVAAIARELGAVCLPRPLVRNAEGLVACNVIWELPTTRMGDSPLECGERSFLSPPDSSHAQRTPEGGAICRVAQLAVADRDAPNAEGETKMAVPTETSGVLLDQGWYYDDFSKTTQESCPRLNEKQRVTFTPMAQPPTGVRVKLECLNEAQSLASTRTDVDTKVDQPEVGDPCDDVVLRGHEVSDDDACVVTLAQAVNGSFEDRSMFCHDESRVCVKACSTDADCPASWVCDTRAESVAAAGRAFCSNPTCGTSQD